MTAVKNNVADLVWQSPGADIQVVSLRVVERLSELYLMEAEIKTEQASLAFADMLHARAEITLKCGPELDVDRTFGGLVTGFTQGRTRHGNLPNATKKVYAYRVEIRPKLWLLTCNLTTRVFQDKSAKDIVDEVCSAHGVAVSWELSGAPPTREYCVQYAETDYQFISRLLEDEGICFFFDHQADKVIFCDNLGGHPAVSPVAEAKYVEEISPRMAQGNKEFISDFAYQETIGTGKLSQHHYNYQTSQTNISAADSEGAVPNYPALEYYEHTENYVDSGQGSRYAGLRKEEMTAWAKVGRGQTSCRGFEAGYCFTMTDHFRDDLNKQWLLTGVDIHIEQGQYHCAFSAQPADVPYRPMRKTPRPKVGGLQTAVVTGPSGAEVYLDDLGRCKLQFHWDREGGNNDRSSMWVRVSNNYAGKDYGIQWIPRIGHEVVVTFIDGNPDLPLVTGRVYNDFNTPPLGPAEKYQNIIKSIKDNHILMDDSDGLERFDVRAQKDMKTHVLNDDTQIIGNNRGVNVGGTRTQVVSQADFLTVALARQMTIGAALNETIGGSHSRQVGGSDTVTVLGSRSMSMGANLVISAKNDIKRTAGRNVEENVDDDYTQKVGKDAKITVKKKMEVKTGDDLTFNCDKKSAYTAKDSITIKCGKASITLKKNGDITISGKKINIKGSGAVAIKGSKISEN